MTYKTADKTENTVEEQTNSGNNLEQRLGEKTPERVQLLLGMRHALKLALGIVNCLSDITSEL